MAQAAQLRRDDLELLARLAADLDQRRTVVGADLLLPGEVVQHLDHGEGLRQRPAATRAARVSGNRDLVGLPRACVGLRPLGLVEDPKLIRVDLLALRAEALVAQQPQVLAQLCDLRIALAKRCVTELERIALPELIVALKNQRTERVDRVRERRPYIPHTRMLGASIAFYKVDA